MDIGEILGMIITILAIVYSIVVTLAQVFGAKRSNQRTDPEGLEDIELDPVQELLRSLEKEQKSQQESSSFKEISSSSPNFKNEPIAHQAGQLAEELSKDQNYDKFEFQTNIEKISRKSAIEGRHLKSSLNTGEELVSSSLRYSHPEQVIDHKEPMGKSQQLLAAHFHNPENRKILFVAREILDRPRYID